jgi:hypothetical protein
MLSNTHSLVKFSKDNRKSSQINVKRPSWNDATTMLLYKRKAILSESLLRNQNSTGRQCWLNLLKERSPRYKNNHYKFTTYPVLTENRDNQSI